MYTFDGLLIHWVSIVATVYDDIDASILEGVVSVLTNLKISDLLY